MRDMNAPTPSVAVSRTRFNRRRNPSSTRFNGMSDAIKLSVQLRRNVVCIDHDVKSDDFSGAGARFPQTVEGN